MMFAKTVQQCKMQISGMTINLDESEKITNYIP